MFLVLLLFLSALTAIAVDIKIGAAPARPGGVGVTPVIFSHVGTNQISSFALYLSNSVPIGLPVASPGPEQTNLTVFVDDFGSGVYRVTGLVLNGPYLTNGRVALLSYQMPEGIIPSVFPLAVTTTSPGNALPGPNPEARAPRPRTLVASAGADGYIFFHIAGVPQPFTSLYVLAGGDLRFDFNGSNGVAYAVQATTNLLDWVTIGPATETAPGSFQFTDPQAVNIPHRFYRLLGP